MAWGRTVQRSAWGATGCLLLIVSGCAGSRLSQRATAFSSAASATTLQVKTGYELVEQTYYEAQVAALVNRFDTQGFDPATIQPFLAEKDREARMDLLHGLEEYAEKLAEVSGDEPIAAVDKNAEALGNSLVALSEDAGVPSTSVGKLAIDAGTASQGAGTAIAALGHALIESRRARELPSLLKSMQQPVDQVCTLLEQDIGDSDKTGLRNELKIKFDELIAAQHRYIVTNRAALSPEAKRAAIEKLPELALAEHRGDHALAETREALRKLAEAHDALAATAEKKDAPEFRVLLAQLIAEAQDLSMVYSAIEAKK